VNPSSSGNQQTLQNSESMRDTLTKALHATTHRAAKQTPGGFALLFTLQGDLEVSEPRKPLLRLAAGFATPKAAQESAKAVYELVEACVVSEKPQTSEKLSALEEIYPKET